MNIGTLEAMNGANGPYWASTSIDHVAVPSGIAMAYNPKKGEHEKAADFTIKVLVGRTWKTAGSASWKEAKQTGNRYVNGAFVGPSGNKIFLNFYPNGEADDAGDFESFDVVYATGGARRAPAAQGAGGGATLDGDGVPF